jgi:hypothetical protein
MNSHFCGIGTRDQVGCSNQIQKMLAIHPFASGYDLFFHHGDVSRRSAKGDAPEFKEE